MNSSVRVGRVAGVAIGIHYTWLVILVLITWTLAGLFLPQQFPHWPGLLHWFVGLGSALLLFCSVLLHELGHALAAKSRGLSVGSIVLFALGGVATVDGEPESPWDELAIAAAGPVVSLALFGFLAAFSFALRPLGLGLDLLVAYAAIVNLIMGVLNLVPGFPLDGGRMLRAVAWAATGSRRRGTEVAVLGGRVVGLVLVMVGLHAFVSGLQLAGAWVVFAGLLLASGANAEHRRLLAK